MMLDLNLLNALASGFEYYKTRESAFKALFTGVSESVKSAWFSELVNDAYPAFRTRNARGSEQAPMIIVAPLSENVTQTLLGDFDSRAGSGESIDAYLIRETCEITLIAKSPDLARVYHVLTRASIALARRPLHKAGYHLVEYGGADALTLEEELAAEELGLFIRRLTTTADHRVAIPIPTASEFSVPVYSGSDLLVLAEDQTDENENPGGVGV